MREEGKKNYNDYLKECRTDSKLKMHWCTIDFTGQEKRLNLETA